MNRISGSIRPKNAREALLAIRRGVTKSQCAGPWHLLWKMNLPNEIYEPARKCLNAGFDKIEPNLSRKTAPLTRAQRLACIDEALDQYDHIFPNQRRNPSTLPKRKNPKKENNMVMKLWLLSPTAEGTKRRPKYDRADNYVVRASSAKAARKLVANGPPKPGDEGSAFWLDVKLSSCCALHSNGKPEIILQSYKAG